jgi:hypothetical protein
MEKKLDLDYCEQCDLPIFDHMEIAFMQDRSYHTFCISGSTQVSKLENLRAPRKD